MTKENYRDKSERLLEKVFDERFKCHEEEKKKCDLYIHGYDDECDLVMKISSGGATTTMKAFKSYKELYFYAWGLYDMKINRIKDYMKLIKNNGR